MSVVYDTGALIAVDRSDASFLAEHRVRLADGEATFVTAPVIAQASRSIRQVRLRRFLVGCEVVPFVAADAHVVGTLLARAGTSDVVDGHVAVVASRFDARIITSDPGDLGHLVSCMDRRVSVLTV